ncbi:AlbA family DNA-binding domain-containing protein [Bacillus sp. OTU530]|uniref:AlbA family DNA-binding domain-containing protein n=1 Tax=Bacillus sp. OTU530 TaxID=3043862 RepID=UPI00313C4DE0
MIPKSLDEWSIDVIKELLIKGYRETEYFDFKEMLPHPREEAGKKRLSKACCAFANSSGGFLVFGISDRGEVDERLVGIPKDVDFPEHFGNYPNRCRPMVDWQFKNPAIELENGNVIHVIHIPKSWNAPHCYGDVESGWFFAKRTNKGDEGMSPEEIRTSYLGYYEKKLKLQLLKAELYNIQSDASSMIMPEEQIGTHYSLSKYELSVLESVLSDTYTILADSVDLLSQLSILRKKCRVANTQIEMFHSKMVIPITNRSEIVRAHNLDIRGRAEEILELCHNTLELLSEL